MVFLKLILKLEHIKWVRITIQKKSLTCLRCWRPCPFLYAVQVKHMITALTTPHWGSDTNQFTAYHALIFFCSQLFNQRTCLKNKTDKLKHRKTFFSQQRISKSFEKIIQTDFKGCLILSKVDVQSLRPRRGRNMLRERAY